MDYQVASVFLNWRHAVDKHAQTHNTDWFYDLKAISVDTQHCLLEAAHDVVFLFYCSDYGLYGGM